MNNYCVYCHTNRINGKKYIGITCNVKNRWSSNGKQYKYCPYFWSAIEKYGWDNFEHTVLIDGLSKDEACVEEIRLIKELNTQNTDYGYNLADGGSGGCTVRGEKHRLSKYVYQYDLDGNFIRQWENAQRAHEQLKINPSDIHVAAKHKNGVKQAGNFMWSYELIDNMEPYVREGRSKASILQIDQDFNIVREYKNIYFVNAKEFNKEKIRICCKLDPYGQFEHKKYYWVYKKDFNPSYIEYIKERIATRELNKHTGAKTKKIAQIDFNGDILAVYNNAREVENIVGINRHTVQAYCKRGISNYGATTGYIWKYLNEID